MDALSATQREAVGQLQALMNGADTEVAIGVLESANWDVQRAANMILDGGAPQPTPRVERHVEAPVQIERFAIDDSEQSLLGHGHGREFRPVNNNWSLTTRPFRAVFAIFAVPLRLLVSIVRFIFRVLHIPFPQFVPFTWSSLTYRPLGPNGGSESRPQDPKSVAERWVRSLEEETGAVCLSRSGRGRVKGAAAGSNGHTVSSGADLGGPSTVTARTPYSSGEDADVETKLLPDFFLGSYEEFVRTCAKNARIGLVVLVSEEHDHVPEFKRSTLTDPTLVKTVQENDILVWGGEIRDREPWSASQKLQATTYPFVAFIALQPRRNAGASSPMPTLTVLSRHQGRSIPAATAPTSAETLASHLNESLLPRVSPYLNRLRAEAAERERERALRAEQDRAFEESRKRDKERVQRRMEEERRAQEESRRQAEAEECKRIEAARAEEERIAFEARRMEWRRYERKAFVGREPRPGEVGRGKTMRVGFRMPDGRRCVRFFGESDTLTALYSFVDSLFIPPEFIPETDPELPPSGAPAGKAGLKEEIERSGKTPAQWWGFELILAYPRKEIPWEPAKRLGETESLKAGGQLVVEMVSEPTVKEKQETTDEDDGYETEE